ncbi:hypothetical protein GCM10027176_43510 [Actinoallomurus bryophytorum]|jgi:hypothetical protein|uniref:Excreted virulence factor EspC (Type VII ESX diderm) n=1 Tax=Actinoallomurus bryophytorum TaxID=1490222 RepID=A0A543CE45_9ACTN|nr:DUF6507 family protein [Actinoallomurus bryophytorum]TQL95371.1 hypothetical protein FB559_0874 [Actinoallomurus bryophytorum]
MAKGWDIDPPGVKSVVTKVAGHVTDGHGGGETLEHHLKDFGDHLENAGNSAASAPIGTALKEFVEHYTPTLKGMATKTGSCIKGAVDATKAYIQGDLEMAAEAQKKAVEAQ